MEIYCIYKKTDVAIILLAILVSTLCKTEVPDDKTHYTSMLGIQNIPHASVEYTSQFLYQTEILAKTFQVIVLLAYE